jgi:hypothetical protein
MNNEKHRKDTTSHQDALKKMASNLKQVRSYIFWNKTPLGTDTMGLEKSQRAIMPRICGTEIWSADNTSWFKEDSYLKLHWEDQDADRRRTSY